MPTWDIIWTKHPEGGNVAHLAEHRVTQEEFKYVVTHPRRGPAKSRSNPNHALV